MACTDCKQSIFDDEPSKIPAPLCADNCPEDVNCNGEVLASACVYVNVALPCVDTAVNEDLTTVLQALDAKVCESNSGNCYVKIDAEDCCGDLESKLTPGDGITITKDAVGRDCKDLTIALDCPTWNNVTYNPLSKVRNNTLGYQTVQYSTVIGCKVTIRGVVNATSYINPNDVTTYVFQLPANHKPSVKRLFGGFITQSGVNYRPYTITIDVDGKVYINISASGSYSLIPFEITFETN